MKSRDFACWAYMIAVGSALAWSAPASAQEATAESGNLGGILTVELIEGGYPGGSGGAAYVAPGWDVGSGMAGGGLGIQAYYPGGFGTMAAYDTGSLPDAVNAQREQLMTTLRQLQDAYCRAAMLDEAVAVRDQIEILDTLSRTPLPQITDPVTSSSAKFPEPNAIDDGRPYSLRGRNDESFYAEVTGRTTGSVWGDGVYTDDSDLATAAVHAGVLQDGETKVVKFTILPGKDSYAALSANGVDARTWGSYSGSFRVDDAALRLGYPYTLRDQGLERVQVFVIGSASAGTVWGTDVYTDDSTLDSTAVHAGIVSEGQQAIVTIELLAGRDSYEGSERNGVTSRPYAAWKASYRFLQDGVELPSASTDATATTESPYNLRGQDGQTFVATVTGSMSGSVWGDGVFTDDSDLATAAVHCSVLQDGETGSVRFTILPGQDSYTSSTKNGVSTGSWSSYEGSYRIEGADQEDASGPRETMSVTGTTTGYVWGSGVYTSDSDVGTAAVHAGILTDGETGTVTVDRLLGCDSYTGSSSNGVETRDYGSWSGSFRFVTDSDPMTRIILQDYSEEVRGSTEPK